MIEFATGSFVVPNSTTGSQAVTGVPFKPKCLIFYTHGPNLLDTSVTDAQFAFGVALSSSARRTFGYEAADAVAPTAVGATRSDAHALRRVFSDGTILLALDLVSMDSNGFTVNISTAPAADNRVFYVALGGDGFKAATVGTITTPTTTGTQTVTTTGVNPNCVLLFNVALGTTIPDNGVGPTGGCIGWATSTTQRGYSAFRQRDAQAFPSAQDFAFRRQRTDKCFAIINNTGVSIEADISSFGSEQFVLDWTTVTAANHLALYVAMELEAAVCGSFNQNTSTGQQSITGVGFRPSGLLFLTVSSASSTLTQSDHMIGLSAASTLHGLQQNRIGSAMEENFVVGVDVTDATCRATSSDAIQTTEELGGVLTQADLVSLDPDGFTIDVTNADATAMEVLFLAFGKQILDPIHCGGGFVPFPR